MKKTISLLLIAVFLLGTVSLSALAAEPGQIGYMALVNKLHPLPEDWEENLKTVHITNSVGDDVEVEEKAFAAYEELREDLEENDGIYLELDSARRSVAAQQADREYTDYQWWLARSEVGAWELLTWGYG